jgi:hypothetical protein
MEVYIQAECFDVHAVSTIPTTDSADRWMKRIRDNHSKSGLLCHQSSISQSSSDYITAPKGDWVTTTSDAETVWIMQQCKTLKNSTPSQGH